MLCLKVCHVFEKLGLYFLFSLMLICMFARWVSFSCSFIEFSFRSRHTGKHTDNIHSIMDLFRKVFVFLFIRFWDLHSSATLHSPGRQGRRPSFLRLFPPSPILVLYSEKQHTDVFISLFFCSIPLSSCSLHCSRTDCITLTNILLNSELN